MSARTILLIHHGEPPDSPDPTGARAGGVDEAGLPDSESLTPRGWQRAGALALLFSGAVPGWIRPDGLFACASHPGRSRLAEQTLTPLARLTGLPLDCSVQEGDEATVLRRAMAVTETVLICWPSESIARLARLVMGERQMLPTVWPSERHDLVWRMVRGVGGLWRFEQRYQRVLCGDTRQPAR